VHKNTAVMQKITVTKLLHKNKTVTKTCRTVLRIVISRFLKTQINRPSLWKS